MRRTTCSRPTCSSTPRPRHSPRRSIPGTVERDDRRHEQDLVRRTVSLGLTADDGVVGSGVASIAYHAGNAADTVVTDASNPALVRSPLGTASTEVGVSTRRDLHVQGHGRRRKHRARADRQRSTSTPPGRPRTAPCRARACGTRRTSRSRVTRPMVVSAWQRGRCDCHPEHDRAAGHADVDRVDRVHRGMRPSEPLHHDRSVHVQGRRAGADDRGTVQPGTSTSAQDASSNTWYSGAVNLHLVGDDGNDGSDIASITYASTGKFTAPSTTVNASTADVNVTPTGDGSSTVTYSLA